MDDVASDHNGKGAVAPRWDRARERANEVRQSALGVVSDTPGWVWAVVAGVILLMIGILAASRYRARHHDHQDHP